MPPGNSGIDQYKESVPGVGGNQPDGRVRIGNRPEPLGTAGRRNASARSRHAGLSPSTVRKLDKQGPDGKATAGRGRRDGSRVSTPARDSGSSSDSGPGMGWVLPVILALALAGALAVVVLDAPPRCAPGPA